ncbi:MAG: EI24 domain-containing protein [Planctomycetota bacterium]
MPVTPCPRCGYDAPGPGACPHCGGLPRPRSLRRRPGGPATGVLDGLLALPAGLHLLFTTPRVFRWLVPPLVLTGAVLAAHRGWILSALDARLDAALGGDFALPGRAWLAGAPAGLVWLERAWAALVAAAEWTLNRGWELLTSQPLRILAWFLLGSLVTWYCFSVAYEAFAGPFLDEIQARIETRWFGEDPRSRLHRPNDIPVARCVRLSSLSALAAAALFLALAVWPGVPGWAAALASPLGLLPAVAADRRYGEWLAWVARVEGRAAWASLQAAVLTGVLLALALPLYFVPGAGYFLFAAVAGFATAVGLLDIPFERRQWTLGARARFLGRHVLPLAVFGASAGFLLAIPVFGPLLMVPAASLGGLWLLCRLDKGHLRPPPGP